MKKTAIVLSAIMMMGVIGFAQNNFRVLKTFRIASSGGWDYLQPGPVNNWLYVSHGTQVNILNKITGDSVGIIENTTGVHGIAFDTISGKGFTSNGGLNNVFVFDINSNKILAQIPTGHNPDAIIYESFSKKIITCNGSSKNLSIIDPVKNLLIDSVPVGGKPETAVSDGKGKLFVNIEDKNEIVVINTSTFKVINRWSIAPGDGPTGLAMDTKTKRLFAGCEKLLVVIDATNGKIIDKIIIGDGCDGVAFDPDSGNIYTSNGADGTMSVIHEQNASKFVLVQNVVTKKGARTIAFDKDTHHIYMPTAEFEPMEAGQKGRPKMKPGTFQVLVVGK